MKRYEKKQKGTLLATKRSKKKSKLLATKRGKKVSY